MTQYIDKDAVVAEIERKKNILKPFINIGSNTCGRIIKHLDKILSFIDTLKVKEVDLETEIIKWEESFGHCHASMGYKETAKHFFELGLKAQKGE